MNKEYEGYMEPYKQIINQSLRLREWRDLSDSELRLRCGELTANEIRTVRAVLNAIAGSK